MKKQNHQKAIQPYSQLARRLWQGVAQITVRRRFTHWRDSDGTDSSEDDYRVMLDGFPWEDADSMGDANACIDSLLAQHSKQQTRWRCIEDHQRTIDAGSTIFRITDFVYEIEYSHKDVD